jgi:hypothetical protein
MVPDGLWKVVVEAEIIPAPVDEVNELSELCPEGEAG